MQNTDNDQNKPFSKELSYEEFMKQDQINDTTNIEIINFSNCDLINIEKISIFSNLITINLSNNKIQYLNGLEKCENLVYLNLNNNYITNLTPLNTFKKLQELHIANNQIHTVKQLIPLIQLAVSLKSLTLFTLEPLSQNYQYNQCVFNVQELESFLSEFLADVIVNPEMKKLPNDVQTLYSKAKVQFKCTDYQYQGETIFLVPHGQGIIKYKDGKTFQGTFQFGLKSRGVEVCDEYKYKGAFDDRGKRQGKGVLELKSGDIFEGNFVDDLLTGKGTALYADNSFYEGDFEGGLRAGNGVFYDTDGSIFTGEWRNDQANGAGRYEDETGTVEEGTWRGNQKVA